MAGGHACQGGVHGRGHVWQGVCMAGGMHGGGACVAGGHAWWGGGMHGRGGMHGSGMHGWGMMGTHAPQHTHYKIQSVNAWAVRILLECILVGNSNPTRWGLFERYHH